MLDEIRGAVARGWCSKENEHKVMDPTLAEAIANEVNNLVESKFISPNTGKPKCDGDDCPHEPLVRLCEHCLIKITNA